MSVKVRSADPSDYPAIVTLSRLCHEKHNWSSIEELLFLEQYGWNNIDIIMLEDETPIGYCIYEYTYKYNIIELNDLVIHPEWSNFGRGTNYVSNYLIEYLSDKLSQIICHPLSRSNRLCNFFTRLGFLSCDGVYFFQRKIVV